MNILLVSIDNSKRIKIGGKHVHQELLEKALGNLGNTVQTLYPEHFSILLRLTLRFISLLNRSKAFERYINFIIDQLKSHTKTLLTNTSYDFISTQDVVATVAVGRALSEIGVRIPIILTLHGYFAREAINYGYFNEKEKNRVLEFSLKLEKEALNYISGLITVDSRIKDYVINTIDTSSPIKVIWNAIDDERFYPVSELEKKKIRKKLKLDVDNWYILVARRFVKKNGVEYALQALKHLKKKDLLSNVKTILIGEGPEYDFLFRYVKENKLDEHVYFLGAINHQKVHLYYQACDIVLLPSTKSDDVEEATSLSMLEGMSCGKPVVASNIGGLKEIIIDGYNGLLFEDKNIEELASKIIELITNNNLYSMISIQSRQYIIKNHGYIQHAQKILDFFNNEIKARGS
ncbi:glycosyltransferase family 4 protein [Bacillaceae bacterium]